MTFRQFFAGAAQGVGFRGRGGGEVSWNDENLSTFRMHSESYTTIQKGRVMSD